MWQFSYWDDWDCGMTGIMGVWDCGSMGLWEYGINWVDVLKIRINIAFIFYVSMSL